MRIKYHYLLFSLILFLVMGVFRLLQTAGNSLVERLRRHPQEEVHNIPEETVAPQVFNYSKDNPFPKFVVQKFVKFLFLPVVSLVYIPFSGPSLFSTGG